MPNIGGHYTCSFAEKKTVGLSAHGYEESTDVNANVSKIIFTHVEQKAAGNCLRADISFSFALRGKAKEIGEVSSRLAGISVAWKVKSCIILP